MHHSKFYKRITIQCNVNSSRFKHCREIDLNMIHLRKISTIERHFQKC